MDTVRRGIPAILLVTAMTVGSMCASRTPPLFAETRSPASEEPFPMEPEMFPVERSGLFGFVDAARTVVIPPIYEDAGNFSGVVVRVRREGKWGYIDARGDTRIPFRYDYAWDFTDGTARVRTGDREHRIDREGREVNGP